MSSSARTYQNLPIRTGSSSAGNVPQSIICWVARALIPCRAYPRPAATDPSPDGTAYHPSRNRTPIPGSGSRSSETLPSRRASPSRHRRRRSGEDGPRPVVVRSPGAPRCSFGRMPLLGRCFRVRPFSIGWVLCWSASEPVRVTGARGCRGVPLSAGSLASLGCGGFAPTPAQDCSALLPGTVQSVSREAGRLPNPNVPLCDTPRCNWRG